MSGNIARRRLIGLPTADVATSGSARQTRGWTIRACAALVLGPLLGAATVAFICTLVYVYQLVTPEEAESIDTMRRLAAGWVPGLFFALGAVGSALLVEVRAKPSGMPAGTLFGILLGIVAAGTEQALVANFEGLLPRELVVFVLLGAVGGAVGGCWGSLEVRWTEAGERALFCEMVNIARAEEPDQVAEAIANLAGRESVAGVGVWSTASFNGQTTEKPTGVWEYDGYGSFPAAILLEVAKKGSRNCSNVQHLLVETLDREARRVWANFGLRSALASPMVYMGGESLGFLFIGFRKATLLTGASRRRLLSAAAAAGLALEKLAGLEKQRKQDRELGMMEERERVSREIHDSLIQYLGSIAGELDAAEMAAEAGAKEMAPRHISRAREAARLATSESRRFMRALRPVVLDETSFPKALKEVTKRSLDTSGIGSKVRIVGEVRSLPPETEHNLLRIVQEALSNAQKHSQASLVSVSLSFEETHVKLEVTDNGVGFDVSHANKTSISNGINDAACGFGLQSVRERTERIGGQMRVESSAGTGTKMIVKAPAANG